MGKCDTCGGSGIIKTLLGFKLCPDCVQIAKGARTMTTPNEKATLTEHLVSLGSLQDRINRFSRHIDSCDECKILGSPMCQKGQRLKEEMSQ